MTLVVQYNCQDDNYFYLHSLNCAQGYQAHHMIVFHHVNKTDYCIFSYNDFYRFNQYLGLKIH